MLEYMGDAPANLGHLTDLLTRGGLKYVDLDPGPVGVGVGISFGETDYLVVTVLGPPNDNQAYITSAVLRNVNQDRAAVLNVCNQLTRDNAAYPTYLHDADAGWDVLIQQVYPVQLLVDVPPFFVSCVQLLPQAAARARSKFGESWLGGMPYSWSPDDVRRLFIRSML
jgi:hypothetical protein